MFYFNLPTQHPHRVQNPHRAQKGIILVATLIIVSIVAGLAITLAYLPVTDQRIIANIQDQIIAKQAAEIAATDANGAISSWRHMTALPAGTCGSGNGKMQDTNFNLDNYATQPLSWWQANGCNAVSSLPGSSQGAMFIVKYLGCDINNNLSLYQIITRGVGASPKTIAYFDKVVTSAPSGNPGGVTSSTPGAALVSVFVGGGLQRRVWISQEGSTGFVPTGGWNGWCQSGVAVWIGCSRNCAGQVRASGYTGGDNPPCQWRAGPWDVHSSSVTLINQGSPTTLQCTQ
jgi:hypothetical protein